MADIQKDNKDRPHHKAKQDGNLLQMAFKPLLFQNFNA